MTTGPLSPAERRRLAGGCYRSLRRRGGRGEELRSLMRLRFGKSRTRDLSDEELVALRIEVLSLPAIRREKHVRPETREEYVRRKEANP